VVEHVAVALLHHLVVHAEAQRLPERQHVLAAALDSGDSSHGSGQICGAFAAQRQPLVAHEPPASQQQNDSMDETANLHCSKGLAKNEGGRASRHLSATQSTARSITSK